MLFHVDAPPSFSFETRSHCIAQTGLEFGTAQTDLELKKKNPPASASEAAGMAGALLF